MLYDRDTVARARRLFEHLRAELAPDATLKQIAEQAEADAGIELGPALNVLSPAVGRAMTRMATALQCCTELARFYAAQDDFEVNWIYRMPSEKADDYYDSCMEMLDMLDDGDIEGARRGLTEWFFFAASCPGNIV